MNLCRLCILASVLSFSAAVAADPVATMLQFSNDFGGRPATRINLRLISSDLDGPSDLGVTLPLYSSGPKWHPMHNTEDRRPFCERSPKGCLAFGLLLGVGIAYFVVAAANDADGDTHVSFTSGSSGVTVNNTR